MIKINLLPSTRAQKAATINETAVQIGIGLAIMVAVLGASGYRWHMLESQIAQQTLVKENKQKEIEDLKKQVAEVEYYERNKQLLEDKNRIIEQLRKNQAGPVRLLDFLSQSLDPLKVWLISVEETSSDISVSGRALSNDDIVEFTKNLQQVNYFSSVLLEESRQTNEEGVTVYQFKLKLKVKA